MIEVVEELKIKLTEVRRHSGLVEKCHGNGAEGRCEWQSFNQF
jgi:hypothetical protein